jgi:hypothetical protein
MSESLERQLNFVLNMREKCCRQHEADQTRTKKIARDAHAELERRQVRFCKEVRALTDQTVARANRYMTARSEVYQFCEVEGYLTGPLYLGGPACNPIAYELRADGQAVGEALILELTHGGMVEAFLSPFRPPDHEAHTTRIDFGWHPIPLYSFDSERASELIVHYFAAITTRSRLGQVRHTKHQILADHVAPSVWHP